MKAWESKNAKNAAKAGGISMMALSLAACGGSDATTATTTTTTTTTTTVDAAQANALTAGFDTFTGGSGDDTFTSTTDGHFSLDDTLVGGAGTDTLYLRAESVADGAVSTTGIEVVDVRAVADYTLNVTNMAGLTTAANNASAVNVTFSGAAVTTGVKVLNVATAAKTTSLDFAAKAIDGTADSVAVEVGGVTAAHSISVNDAGAGTVETLNINSSAKNTGAITLTDDALTATTMNVTGAGDITLAGDITSGTIDASAATGKVDVTFGTVATARTITGGTGDDTFSEQAAGDLVTLTTIAGGDGTDTLELLAASGTILATGAAGNVTNVSGIETLKLATETTAATAIDMSKITGLKNLTFVDVNDAGAADAITITKLLDGATLTLGDDADTLTAQITYSFAANSAANDLNLAITSISTPDIITGDGFADGLNVAATGANELNVASATVKTITATGTGSLDLDDGGTTLNASTTTVDASGLTGALVVTASGTSTTITGGAGGDTITGGAGADVIVGGAGADTLSGAGGADDITAGAGGGTIDGGAGADTITLGSGADTVQLRTDATADTIKGFTIGASADQLDISEGDMDATTQLTTGNGVDVTAATGIDFATGANGAAITLTATDSIIKISDITGLDANSDLSLNVTQTANSATDGDGMLVLWYDADDASAVLSIAVDTDSDSDATINTSNVTMTDVASIEMSTADFTNINIANFDFIA